MNSLKILSIVGARPQFIKAAPVLKAIGVAGHRSLLLHTGQHYDSDMSQVFFDQLDIQKPDWNLEVGSGTAVFQTSEIMRRMESVLREVCPDWIFVFGDTNSTLAGALCGLKSGVPIAHVEAGLRSYNWKMPEEENRVLTDHCSKIRFCPTEQARKNLELEGIRNGIHVVGDSMVDALATFIPIARKNSAILSKMNILPGEYCLATIHRASNTDDLNNLESLVTAIIDSQRKTVFPLHPRTSGKIKEQWKKASNIIWCAPLSYFDMLVLESNANIILTDSGGVQKEAFLFGVPCITLRNETEWVETVELGWNTLAGTSKERVLELLSKTNRPSAPPPPIYGDGKASTRMIKILESFAPC